MPSMPTYETPLIASRIEIPSVLVNLRSIRTVMLYSARSIPPANPREATGSESP